MISFFFLYICRRFSYSVYLLSLSFHILLAFKHVNKSSVFDLFICTFLILLWHRPSAPRTRFQLGNDILILTARLPPLDLTETHGLRLWSSSSLPSLLSSFSSSPTWSPTDRISVWPRKHFWIKSTPLAERPERLSASVVSDRYVALKCDSRLDLCRLLDYHRGILIAIASNMKEPHSHHFVLARTMSHSQPICSFVCLFELLFISP